MKISSALPLALLLAASTTLAGEVIRLSEPVEVTEDYEVFGAPIGQMDSPLSLGDVVAEDETFAGQEVLVRATVAQVCQRKGCFFIAQDGDAIARVTFKDYGFFVPTDTSGKLVTIRGTFGRKVVSEAKARHYAEDAGEDPAKVVGARPEYTIVATSVVVPKSPS